MFQLATLKVIKPSKKTSIVVGAVLATTAIGAGVLAHNGTDKHAADVTARPVSTSKQVAGATTTVSQPTTTSETDEQKPATTPNTQTKTTVSTASATTATTPSAPSPAPVQTTPAPQPVVEPGFSVRVNEAGAYIDPYNQPAVPFVVTLVGGYQIASMQMPTAEFVSGPDKSGASPTVFFAKSQPNPTELNGTVGFVVYTAAPNGDYRYKLTISDSNKTASATFVLHVTDATPRIAPPSL
jgi:hypothetical protein